MKEMKTDILVVGGGFGGVSAAIAAAKLGRNVVITEASGWLGGQATTQGVPIDEHPWIEQYGSSRSYREFRRLIREYYRNFYPLHHAAQQDSILNPGAGWVSGLGFEPRVGCAVIEQLLAPLRSAGRLTTYMHHRPVAAEVQGDRIISVTVENTVNGDKLLLQAPIILDATELGELLELAGVEHVIGSESISETGEPSALDGPADPLRQQGFTHLAAVDYLPGEDHTIAKPETYDSWRANFSHLTGNGGGMQGLFAKTIIGDDGSLIKSPFYSQCIWNFRRVLCRDNFIPGAFPSDITMLMCGNELKGFPIVGVSAEEAAANMRKGRELTLSLIYFLQTEIESGYQGKPGFPGIRPRGDVFDTGDGLAQYPYIRESRRIKAEFTVKEQHFRKDWPGNENGPVLFEDSVGVGAYRIDIHEPAKNHKDCVTNVLHGNTWPQQIPLGSLIPIRIDNLIPACKNIGSTHITNGCFRLHCTEWNIGEAAGALAAFSLERSLPPRGVRSDKNVLGDFKCLLKKMGVEMEWPGMSFGQSYASHFFKGANSCYGGEAWRLYGN